MLRIGDSVEGKYVIKKKIGEGGMSFVWLCERKSDRQILALKEIDKSKKAYYEITDGGKLYEAEIVKNLNHPLIPSVYDVYEDEESIIIVMEYVQGKSMKSIIQENNNLPEDLIVGWAISICEIFIYLHTRPRPVIYRDLKPDNIIVNKEGGIRLLDFGVAIELPKGEKSIRTRAFGTRGFASPEQIKGYANERTDIYTMGMCFYYLLSGKNPARKDFTYEPLEKIRTDINPRLCKVIEKAIQEDPRSRYQSTSELMKELLTYKEKKKKGLLKELLVAIAIILIILIGAYACKLIISSKSNRKSTLNYF